MKAAILRKFDQPLSIEEVPTPTPGADEVLVRVMACGVDGTDLKLLKGFGYTPRLPFIMGHEPAGVVAAVGDHVLEFTEGDRVIPYIFLVPPESPYYRSEREQLCPELDGVVGVKGWQGAYAEYLCVPARQLVRLPDTISWEDAAVLCDAGITAFHAVDRARIKLGETVVVIGVGGVGSFAVQFAKLAGARVIAVEKGIAKSAHALALGADEAIDAGAEDVAAAVRRLTSDAGARCVLDIVGTSDTLSAAVDSLQVGGRLVVVGYTSDEYSLSGKRLAQNELELIGSRCGPKRDLKRAVDLAAAGKIRSVVTDVLPLEEVNTAHERLRGGGVLGRLVLRVSRDGQQKEEAT